MSELINSQGPLVIRIMVMRGNAHRHVCPSGLGELHKFPMVGPLVSLQSPAGIFATALFMLCSLLCSPGTYTLSRKYMHSGAAFSNAFREAAADALCCACW